MNNPFDNSTSSTPSPTNSSDTPIEAAVAAAATTARTNSSDAPVGAAGAAAASAAAMAVLNAAAPAEAEAAAAPKGPTFAELGLHADVLRAVDEMGFTHSMPVQAATFPLITQNRDLMVQSRTGSGKTAAFGIPFANGLVNPDEKFVQAIVLLPTRELALQVAAELAKICQYRQMTVVPVYGGA